MWRLPSYMYHVNNKHPVDTELYRCANPIVEENGETIFKLEFDVRRFR